MREVIVLLDSCISLIDFIHFFGLWTQPHRAGSILVIRLDRPLCDHSKSIHTFGIFWKRRAHERRRRRKKKMISFFSPSFLIHSRQDLLLLFLMKCFYHYVVVPLSAPGRIPLFVKFSIFYSNSVHFVLHRHVERTFCATLSPFSFLKSMFLIISHNFSQLCSN